MVIAVTGCMVPLSAEFVAAFGTHYPDTVSLGASSFYYSSFTQSTIETMVEEVVDITAAANLDFISAQGGDISGSPNYGDWKVSGSRRGRR
jgi:hypothetical protein